MDSAKAQPKENSKTLALLNHLAHTPMTFTECQRFVYNLTYPNRKFTREQRGWWSTCLAGVHGTYAPPRPGILTTFCVKGADGKYRRNNIDPGDHPWKTARELMHTNRR